MNHNEAASALGFRGDTIRQDDVNPLRVAINMEFVRDGEGVLGDYRERAINHCLAKRVGFTSEFNTISEVVKRTIRIQCPKCGSNMVRSTHSGGTAHAMTYEFRCPNSGGEYDCNCKLELSLPPEAIRVRFPEDVQREDESCAKRGVTYCGSH